MERTDVRGVRFDNVTMDEALDRCRGFLKENKNHYVVTPNAEIVQACIEDEEVGRVVNSADLVIPDGIGVIYAARILGRPLKEKVAGVDLGTRLLGVLEKEGLGLFLLGSKPGVAERAAQEMKRRHPDLIISGVGDGYFKDDGPVIERINESGAAALFVCLGAPKQEKWMEKNRGRLNTRLMLGLGGVLDVFAGDAKRAPDIFIKLGLEWFYRLIKEPYRIGRMMKLPKFLIGTVFAKGEKTNEQA